MMIWIWIKPNFQGGSDCVTENLNQNLVYRFWKDLISYLWFWIAQPYLHLMTLVNGRLSSSCPLLSYLPENGFID